jgi:vacuolar protein sorting-associated protein 13A/C
VFAGVPEGNVRTDSAATSVSSLSNPTPEVQNLQMSLVNLEPEIRVSSTLDGSQPWTTIDLVASIAAVRLHLYDREATTEADLRDHGIVRFALNDVSLRSKSMSDGASEAQLVLRSFTTSNTRPGGSKFREIVPAANHERNQFMVLYSSSGTSALVIMTVDAPHIIFSVEPIFSLLSFFTSGPPSPMISDKPDERETRKESSAVSTTDLRFELHDVSISVLENDTDTCSQAIRLRINQILMSQQVSIAPANHG